MNPQARYDDNLSNPRPPGTGCHSWIMSMANLGIMAGKDPQEIHNDLRRSIPMGTRRIPDKEISDAIRKAMVDYNGGTFTPRPRPAPIIKDGATALQRIINQGKITTEADLWEASPIRLWKEPQSDAILLLETLYNRTDLLFIGERVQPGIIGDTIRTTGEWITFLQDGGKTGPHIIPNPMTGQEGTTKDGKPSFRSDNTVLKYLHCVVEFDDLPRADQIRFWSAARLPVVCLIDSGGKSIHAWLDVSRLANVQTAADWQREIRGRLYDQALIPLGVDSACSNPSRLSRLPGHFRTEKQAWQRLLWLSPEGRPISC